MYGGAPSEVEKMKYNKPSGYLFREFEDSTLDIAKRYQLTREEAVKTYQAFVNHGLYLAGRGLVESIDEKVDPIRARLKEENR